MEKRIGQGLLDCLSYSSPLTKRKKNCTQESFKNYYQSDERFFYQELTWNTTTKLLPCFFFKSCQTDVQSFLLVRGTSKQKISRLSKNTCWSNFPNQLVSFRGKITCRKTWKPKQSEWQFFFQFPNVKYSLPNSLFLPFFVAAISTTTVRNLLFYFFKRTDLFPTTKTLSSDTVTTFQNLCA